MAVLDVLVRRYEALHPEVDVEVLHIPDNYYQKLHILIAGGLTPDVMFTNSISFPIYALHHVFMDLSAPLKKSTEIAEEDYFPQALKAFTWYNDKGQPSLQAIPRDVSNLVVYYNRELLQEAGLSAPKVGWTWQEFVETAKKLTVDADHNGHPEQFGVSFSKYPLYWMPFVWSADGWLFSGDFKHFVLNEPKALQGIRFYSNLRNKHHVAPKQIESGGVSMSQLFMQKKIAMLIDGRWRVPYLRNNADFIWDVVPLPIGPSGYSRVGIDSSGYGVSAQTKHPDEAFELVSFLTNRRSIQRFSESGLIVPARKDVAQSDVFLAPDKLPKNAQVFLDVVEFGVPTRTPPRWNEISEEVNLALEPVWDGTKSPAAALDPIQHKLDAILEESR